MSHKAALGCELVRGFHAGRSDVEDAALAKRAADRACRRCAARQAWPSLLRRFGNQHLTFSRHDVSRASRNLSRRDSRAGSEIFCDAGAGYGHVVLYGACVADCRFRAVEILPARCCGDAKQRATPGRLHNVEIIAGRRADAKLRRPVVSVRKQSVLPGCRPAVHRQAEIVAGAGADADGDRGQQHRRPVPRRRRFHRDRPRRWTSRLIALGYSDWAVRSVADATPAGSAPPPPR